MSASSTRRIASFGLRPWAATPKYRRAWVREAGAVRAKNESRRSGPGGGKTRVTGRAKSAWICSRAWRTVAVEATIFGFTGCPSMSRTHSDSITVS